MNLLLPSEVDAILRFFPGRTERLIREGKIPAIKLPGEEYRVPQNVIDDILALPAEFQLGGERRLTFPQKTGKGASR